MTEHFRLQQRIGQGAAINRNEGLVTTWAISMNRPGDQLLPGPALPLQQHRAPALRDPGHQLIDIQHRRAAPDQRRPLFFFFQFNSEALVFPY